MVSSMFVAVGLKGNGYSVYGPPLPRIFDNLNYVRILQNLPGKL
jgi:hypothetical protein